jgi:crotonobetainyl-CoA hydratase/dehydration protein DpgD
MTGGNGRIQYRRDGRIATITINRPEALNALTDEMHHALAATYRQFVGDDEAWVAVVRGEGERAFSVGRDMKERAALFGAGGGPRQGPAWPEIDKPMIAAIRGYALGLGFLETLRCDIRIAAEDARFGLSEVRVGMPGPVEPVIRVLPFGAALYLLLTGAQIDATQAQQFGLVQQVVPASELEAATMAVAQTIAANAPLAVRATKQNAYHARSMAPEAAQAFIRMNSARVMQSEDVREGARAFAEKRRPEWRGR